MSFDQRGFYKETGKLLQKHRKRANMTQYEVAKELDMPRGTYANIESGRQRAPSDVIWRLSIVFSVPINKLLPEPLIEGENKDQVDETNQQPDLTPSGTSSNVG